MIRENKPPGECACDERKTCSNCAEAEFWALYHKTKAEAASVEEQYEARSAKLDQMMADAKTDDDRAKVEQKRQELADWYHAATYRPYPIPEPSPKAIVREHDPPEVCGGYRESDGSIYQEVVSPRAFRDYLRRRRRSMLGG